MAGKKIKLDEDIYRRALKFSAAQGYSSLEEFICHIIEKELQLQGGADAINEIERKMKGLGYFS
ncbi:MAG: hypothetical protein EHM72_08550 [Calditrichaeota bacterium]|nr:MAG: hypothetical protein EHM72_08550 [Calditrichota bacterium]